MKIHSSLSLFICLSLCLFQKGYSQTNNANPYGKPTNLNNSNFHITNITLGSINNETTQSVYSDRYTYFNNKTTAINKGSTYALDLTFVVPANNNYKLKAWIDYNNDKVFDASEEIGGFDEAQPDPTITKTITFTVPNTVDVTPSNSRIRIFLARNNVDPLSTRHQSGEVEDYNITIKPFPVAPTASCVGALNLTLDILGNASIATSDVNNSSSDDYDAPGDLILSLDKTTFDCSDIGANTVTLTVTDSDGLTDTCTTTVNITGYSGAFVAPVLEPIEAYCSYTAIAPVMDFQCSQIILPITTDPLFYDTPGPHTITWIYDNGTTTVSANQTITINTPPVLTTPTANEFAQTSTKIIWTGGNTGDPVIIRYKLITDLNWLTTTSTSNTVKLTGLNIGVEYEAQVKIAGDCGTYTPSVTFETIDVEYCENTPIRIRDNAGYYISQTNIDDINNTTVTSDGPYDYYENLSASLTTGGTITGEVTYHRRANNNVGFIVWIDYNQDGHFEGANEIVYSSLNSRSSQTDFTASFSNIVPITALPGKTRMRVAISHNRIPVDDCIFDQNGEIEDYNIFIRPIPMKPTAKTKNIQINLDVSGNAIITPDQINNGSFDDFDNVAQLAFSLDTTTFNCDDVNQTKTVTLTVQDTDGLTDTATAQVKIFGYPGIFRAPVFPDVNPYCDYTVVVPVMNFRCETEITGILTSAHTIGEVITSNTTITWNFTHEGETVTSTQNIIFVNPITPTNILFTNITRTTANLIWQNSNVGPYKVRYRENGTSTAWTEKTTIAKNTLLTGLDSGTIYELQVAIDASCATYSSSKIFTTNPSSPLEGVMISQILRSDGNSSVAQGNIIELKNTSGADIASNTITIALFKNASGNLTGVTPDATYTIPNILTSNDVLLIKNTTAAYTSYTGTPLEDDGITNFGSNTDVLIITSSTDGNAWTNRFDVITNTLQNHSYVRNDFVENSTINFNTNQWTIFVDNTLSPGRAQSNGGPERLYHDPLLSIIADSGDYNARLGVHNTGVTESLGASDYTNGLPDRSRFFIINNGYNRSVDIRARSLTVKDGARVKINKVLEVTDTLTIEDGGQIRMLKGSQFAQTHTGTSKVFGLGRLYMEQKSDVANVYRFNYLSSPVNNVGSNSYNVATVLRDGTDPLAPNKTPANINFIAGSDGSKTIPISIPDKWIYTFTNKGDDTSNFELKESTGLIGAVDGFTIKGPGAAQNYIFVGTPKDGDLTTTISPDQFYLVGNPYPSAIRASAFIEDNLSSTDGTLYFWDHIGEQETGVNGHFFGGYIGGYATRNVTMGLSADNYTENNTDPNSETPHIGVGTYKTPLPYIPVGQGFFVAGNSTGGQIIFKNSQRRILGIGSRSIFFKAKKLKTIGDNPNNTDEGTEEIDEIESMPIMKIGLDYTNNEHLKLHHQIGISFNSFNSFAYEPGYDSESPNESDTTVSWKFENDDKRYAITGVQEISDNLKIPLEIKVGDNNQSITIDIDEWQNIDREVYLLDKKSETSYPLDQGKATLNLSPGSYTNRFAITFKETKKLSVDEIELQKISISSNNKTIKINNTGTTTISEIDLFNIIGQKVKTFPISNNKRNISLDVKTLQSNLYIIKISTNKGNTTQKIIIE